ncbi:gliding motility-associated ABC transporter ATP-binding subunit GldA [Galbibacter sp. BG1]|uniref:gliding motility-associated ABC transporter ATP-binding subunit GldA n=1 Tax=Galbibacter sp. BG1 TaxID=1170699 RepID=UPI0015BC6EC1|nr:gliding motility-associated ABC transporter ATP-binding subunit GldA [Galbibacter sp. BG1]QLE01774.1 gliding motility-associated ABC transporter ATP-binding subunit GldA [Galbibacter sp. BG1]
MSIKVANISKNYGEQEALKDVSFSINKGEIVGFLGPNGAGKSTMMKILTTFIAPSSGSAEVNHFAIDRDKMGVQKSVGYLPEHNPLHLDMYVREYLEYTASLYKTPKNRIEELISQCGLKPEANKKIGALSKGYRQRVGLAAALIGNPEVLILDEPTTGLDPNQLLEIRKLIKNIGKEKTVLLSTHIMQEVEAICDRVIIINKGKIVADKKLADLRKSQQQIIEVEFDYRVEDVLLKQLPMVTKVKNTIGFVYELTFETDKDMRAKVFDFAHDNGLKTLQLNQKNKNLESLFIELTNK